ncbi:hypothetical protein [Planococcus sp. YIM B11945]|uniref:hypothetical protein n=1 Tax=Planococcus sp. YIM B11945 TaxID=3435410 RepID=UPI003D7EEDCD
MTTVVTEEERVMFESELHKLNCEYRKCVNRSLKQEIEKDISLIRSAIQLAQNEKSKFW